MFILDKTKILILVTALVLPLASQAKKKIAKPVQNMEAKMNLDFQVKLSYGQDYEDPTNKVPVLLQEYIFKNMSATETYAFSVWNWSLGIKSISPKAAVSTYQVTQGLGMPSPPTAKDLVTLLPGKTHIVKAWYWAKSDLPWVNMKKTEGYLLNKEGPLVIEFCVDLVDHTDIFKEMGIKSPKQGTGKYCAPKVKFDFKILTTDDE